MKIKGVLLLQIALILMSIFLVSFHLNEIPGLHGDEAWVGLRAHDILQGERPWVGMNDYTGPLHAYGVALLFRFLGYDVSILRGLTGAFSVLSLWFYFLVAKRFFGEKVAMTSSFLLVSSPFFIAFNRQATENFALNPILALGALFLITRSSDRPVSFGKSFLGGVLLGFGVWNHLIFIAVPLALWATSWVCRVRRQFSYPVFAGFFFGLLPRIYYGITTHHFLGHALGASGGVGRSVKEASLTRVREWGPVFLQLMQGDVIYQRYAGQVLQHLPPLVPLFFVLSLIVLFKKSIEPPKHFLEGLSQRGYLNRYKLFSVFMGVCFLFTLMVCPGNSDRYFLIPLYCAPLAVAIFFDEVSKFKSIQRFVEWTAVGVVLLQLWSVGVNYLASQSKSHGKVGVAHLGSLIDTSNHFIRTDLVYQKLVEIGARHIEAEFFIALPLQFYDLKNRFFKSVKIVEGNQQQANSHFARVDEAGPEGPSVHSQDFVAVVYAEGGVRRLAPENYIDLKSMDLKSGRTQLESPQQGFVFLHLMKK